MSRPTSEFHDLPPTAYGRMALVLRVGLLSSLGILVVALVAYHLRHPGVDSSQILANNPILGYLTASGFLGGLAAGEPTAYLTLGLVVLVATPIVRVVSGCYYFTRNGERSLSAVTLAVTVLLLFGLLVLGPLVR